MTKFLYFVWFYWVKWPNQIFLSCTIIAISQCWLFALRANIRISPQTSVFAPEFNFRYLRSGLKENMSSRRRIHLSWWFHFKLFKLYSNILKRVNLIEIRFYAPSFLVLWHIFFETTAQIPEVMPLKYVLIPAGKPRDINIGTNFSAACYIPWCLLYGTSQIHNSPLEQYVNEFLLNGQCHAPYNLQQFLMNSIFYYHILCFNT
jgi:hypothetical protein